MVFGKLFPQTKTVNHQTTCVLDDDVCEIPLEIVIANNNLRKYLYNRNKLRQHRFWGKGCSVPAYCDKENALIRIDKELFYLSM